MDSLRAGLKPIRNRLSPKGLVTVNIAALSLSILLLIGSMQAEALVWRSPPLGMVVKCVWGLASVALTAFFAVFTLCLVVLNISYWVSNRRMVRAPFLGTIWALITLAIAGVVMIPSAVSWVEERSRDEALSIVSDQHRAVAEVCEQIFQNPDYIHQLPPGVGSYVQVGNNDHVVVWMDNSGDAIWFDHGGSTSSFGVVCVRQGVAPEEAITGYRRRVEEGRLYHLHNTLYYWP